MNRFSVSPEAIGSDGKELQRNPIGFYYGRMGAKTYQYVIKRVCKEAGIEKPITSSSLRRTGVTLMKVFIGLSDTTVAKVTKHKLEKHKFLKLIGKTSEEKCQNRL